LVRVPVEDSLAEQVARRRDAEERAARGVGPDPRKIELRALEQVSLLDPVGLSFLSNFSRKKGAY